jgi:hypothetical protein
MLSPVFKPFVEQSPISVMARGMIERVLNPDFMDQWFEATAKEQYTKDLLFSTVLDLMIKVVSGKYKSVHAAYQALEEDIGVSITSVYNKLNGIEPNTSAELVRYATYQVEPIIRKLGGTVRYPDSGKLAILPTLEVFEGGSTVDYYQKEEQVRSQWPAEILKKAPEG